MSSETEKKKAYLIYLKWNSFVERLETFKHKFGEKTTEKALRNEKTKLTSEQQCSPVFDQQSRNALKKKQLRFSVLAVVDYSWQNIMDYINHDLVKDAGWKKVTYKS